MKTDSARATFFGPVSARWELALPVDHPRRTARSRGIPKPAKPSRSRPGHLQVFDVASDAKEKGQGKDPEGFVEWAARDRQLPMYGSSDP